MLGIKSMTLDPSPKYGLTSESMKFNGHIVHRICALKDFDNVKAGVLGGWVESDKNLSQDGTCWVADNAIVCGDAVVNESAIVRGNVYICESAVVSGEAEVFGSAIVADEARVCGTSKVSGDSQVYGKATVTNAFVEESASVEESAVVENGATIRGSSAVSGAANVSGKVLVKDSALVCGDARVFSALSKDGQPPLHTVIENSAKISGNAVVTGATVGVTVVINDCMRVEGCNCLRVPHYLKGDNFALTSPAKGLLSFTSIFQNFLGCTHTFKEWHDEYQEILIYYFQTYHIAGFTELFNEMCDLTGNQVYKI